jgi:hypothetical protein
MLSTGVYLIYISNSPCGISLCNLQSQGSSRADKAMQDGPTWSSRRNFKAQVNTMPVFKRPHLKVEQPHSAFAEGNKRWYIVISRRNLAW